MIKLKQIVEQDDIEAVWAKQDKQKADADFRQQQLIDKGQGEFRSGEFQPISKTSTSTNKVNTDKDQVKKIFDNSANLPSSELDWQRIKPIAEAMHSALSGAGAGDFLDQLKKIRTQAQLSALIKNWVYDGQTLFEWLEEEYTISWKQILDIIKPIQSIVGKYAYGLFDVIYDNLKSKGWKISTSNILDANFMYKGMWVIRRNSNIITYGNKSTGIVEFSISDYSTLNSSPPLFIDFYSINILGRLGNDLFSNNVFKFTTTFGKWESILAQHKYVYIYFLSKTYTKIVENYFDKVFKQIYDDARKWWIDKLSDPQFSRIFMRVNKSKPYAVKSIVDSYKRRIKSVPIKTEFIGDGDDTYGGYYWPAQNEIYIVCDRIKSTLRILALENKAIADPKTVLTLIPADDISYLLSTAVHELQHSIWDILPLNQKTNWEEIQPYDINVGKGIERLWYSIFGANVAAVFPTEKQISAMSRTYNIDKLTLDSWVIETKEYQGSGFYPCDINEHQSRLEEFKLRTGLKTEDPITVKNMVTAINYGPYEIGSTSYEMWSYIIMCWVRNSMTDIASYIGWLNTKLIVKQDSKQSKKDKRTDFNQSA